MRWNPAAASRNSMRRVASGATVAALLVAGVVASAASAAGGSPPVSPWNCGWSTSCLDFSGWNPGTGWWDQLQCDNDRWFNCTNYVAYRLEVNGVPNFMGGCGAAHGSNAQSWDERARGCGIRVDTAPAAGGIIQWDGGAPTPGGTGNYTDAGHVAYIDAVDGDTLYVSQASCENKAGSRVTLTWPIAGVGTGAVEVLHPRDLSAPVLPSFAPSGTITRAELATWLYRLEGAPEVTATPLFADVPATHPQFKAIQWMREREISTATNFNPGWLVTREVLAVYLYRLDGSEPLADPQVADPTDLSQATPAFQEAVSWIVGSGLSHVSDDGGFHPRANAARHAVATILYRYEEMRTGVAPSVELPTDPIFSDVTGPSSSYSYDAILWVWQQYVARDFVDVNPAHPFYHEIMWMVREGITTGYSDGSYRPGDPVSRRASAAFLYRYAGSPAFDEPSTSPFDDLAPGDPFYREITWMADQGISTGYVDGTIRTFRPGNSVSRAAMAAFVYRFAGSPAFDEPATSPFDDLAPGDPFYTEITWMADQGISTGYSDDTFRPGNSVSREAMAAFLFRLNELP